MNYIKLIQVFLWISASIILMLAGIMVNLAPVYPAAVIFIGLTLAVVGITFEQNLFVNFAFWVNVMLAAGLVFTGLNHFLAMALVLVMIICWDICGYIHLISPVQNSSSAKFLANHVLRLAIVVVVSFVLTWQALRFELQFTLLIQVFLMLAIGMGIYILTRLLAIENSTNAE